MDFQFFYRDSSKDLFPNSFNGFFKNSLGIYTLRLPEGVSLEMFLHDFFQWFEQESLQKLIQRFPEGFLRMFSQDQKIPYKKSPRAFSGIDSEISTDDLDFF